MTLISNGISAVRACVLPTGVDSQGNVTASPRWAIVQWESPYKGMYYQVYVAGCFAGVTTISEQRKMLVPVPMAEVAAVPIEVFAVSADDADTDFSQQLPIRYTGYGYARLKILKCQSLPIDGSLQIYSNNGTGEIDYNTPLNEVPIPLWPIWQKKAGFGLGRFGSSDFGWDGSAAIGFGAGVFGLGQFGLDAEQIVYQTQILPTGTYHFEAVVVDDNGEKYATVLDETVTVIPAAKSPQKLNIVSYDADKNELIIEIS